MSTLSAVEEAIRRRVPIDFEYIRPGKTLGARIGDPHAVFIKRLKSGEERVYLHLWQTDGVTDSNENIPGWRQFFLNDIHNPLLLEDAAPFEIAEGYNPTFYEFPISKI